MAADVTANRPMAESTDNPPTFWRNPPIEIRNLSATGTERIRNQQAFSEWKLRDGLKNCPE